MSQIQRITDYLQSYSFIANSSSWPKLWLLFGWSVLLIVIIGHGVLLRFHNLENRDFWTDEVWRAQQILHASDYQELSSGKFFGHEAPVQYSEFLLGKLGLKLFGKGEMAYRVWPLVFSLISLLLISYIASSYFSPFWSILAVFLFSTSYGYVEHAHEFKPYTLEIMLALLSLAIGVYIDRSQKKTLSWLFLVVFLLMVVATNIAPFFIFLPVLVLYQKRLDRILPYIIAAAILCFFCALAASFYYSGYMEQLQENKIFAFWQGYYLDTPEKWHNMLFNTLPRTLGVYFFSYRNYLKQSWEISAFIASVVFFVSPIIMVWKRNVLAVFLFIPFVLQLGLAILGFYPFLSRVGAFYYPFLILSFCYLCNLVSGLFTYRYKVFFSVIGLMLSSWLFRAYTKQVPIEFHVGTNRHIESFTPLLSYFKENATKGDLLIPGYSAHLSFHFYAPELLKQYTLLTNRPGDKRISLKKAKEFLVELSKDYPGRKAWIFATFRLKGFDVFQEAANLIGAKVLYAEKKEGAYLIALQLSPN